MSRRVEYKAPTNAQVDRRAASFRALAAQMKGSADVVEAYAEAYEAMRADRDFWKKLSIEFARRQNEGG